MEDNANGKTHPSRICKICETIMTVANRIMSRQECHSLRAFTPRSIETLAQWMRTAIPAL